jgi:hypothetical protein
VITINLGSIVLAVSTMSSYRNEDFTTNETKSIKVLMTWIPAGTNRAYCWKYKLWPLKETFLASIGLFDKTTTKFYLYMFFNML